MAYQYNFRETARLTIDKGPVRYRPSRLFVRTVIVLAALIVLLQGIAG